MADISMCLNHKCKLKESCYRYKAYPSPFNQSYSKFEPKSDTECDAYMEIYKPKINKK